MCACVLPAELWSTAWSALQARAPTPALSSGGPSGMRRHVRVRVCVLAAFAYAVFIFLITHAVMYESKPVVSLLTEGVQASTGLPRDAPQPCTHTHAHTHATMRQVAQPEHADSWVKCC